MYVVLKNLRADGHFYTIGDILNGDSPTIDYEKLIALGFIKFVKTSAVVSTAAPIVEEKPAAEPAAVPVAAKPPAVTPAHKRTTVKKEEK